MTTHTEPIDRLRATLADATDHPTADSLQRLATASMLHGILHAASLDIAVIALANRIDSIGQEAIDELSRAITRYTGSPPPQPDATPTRESDTPHVGVRWPACPSCGHDARDKTFTGTNRRHTLPDGSPGVYAQCRQCSAAVVVEHWDDQF